MAQMICARDAVAAGGPIPWQHYTRLPSVKHTMGGYSTMDATYKVVPHTMAGSKGANPLAALHMPAQCLHTTQLTLCDKLGRGEHHTSLYPVQMKDAHASKGRGCSRPAHPYSLGSVARSPTHPIPWALRQASQQVMHSAGAPNYLDQCVLPLPT